MTEDEKREVIEAFCKECEITTDHLVGLINRRVPAVDFPDIETEIVDALPVWIAAIEYERSREKWMPIETAPKDGTEIIVSHPVGGVCAAFCMGESYAWNVMDGCNTVPSNSAPGKTRPGLTSFCEPPTHWMPMPAPPKDTQVSDKEKP